MSSQRHVPSFGLLVRLGDGASAKFWTDSWLPDGPLCSIAPSLFQAIDRRRTESASLGKRHRRSVHGSCPLRLCPGLGEDRTCAPAGNVSGPVRLALDCGRQVFRLFGLPIFLRRNVVAHRCKGTLEGQGATESEVFLLDRTSWQAVDGRTPLATWPTTERYLHPVRARPYETTDHLLTSCVFARESWCRLLHLAGLQGIGPQDQATLADWWLRSRKQVPKAARKEFDSAVLLTSWNLWKERNRRTFDRVFLGHRRSSSASSSTKHTAG